MSQQDVTLEALGSKHTLFYIERNIDDAIVVYQAMRLEGKNNLVAPYVKIYWSSHSSPSDQEPVSQKAQDMFFGVTVRKEPKQYHMCVAALKQHKISLHLKSSGEVVAKAVIDGKESRLTKIAIHMSSSIIPKVHHLTIHGMHKNQDVMQEITVTTDMMKQFDLKEWIPKFSDFLSL